MLDTSLVMSLVSIDAHYTAVSYLSRKLGDASAALQLVSGSVGKSLGHVHPGLTAARDSKDLCLLLA
jgi:hypothetical protein